MTVKIGGVNAGTIGRRLAEVIDIARGVVHARIADPAGNAQHVPSSHGLPWHPSVARLPTAGGLDAVFPATPNQMHSEGAPACIDAGPQLLVEKPLFDDHTVARGIVEAASRAAVPIATGHHRHHDPLITRAKPLVEDGLLGRHKPDDFFGTEWRRKKGAGPVYRNRLTTLICISISAAPLRRCRRWRAV